MEVSIFQVFGAAMAMGEAMVPPFQGIFISFLLLFLLPSYYSIPDSDPRLNTVFYRLVLKPQIANVNYKDML